MKDIKNYPLRLKPETFDALVKRAEKNNRSINAEINTILEDTIEIQKVGVIKDGTIDWFNTPEGIEQSR